MERSMLKPRKSSRVDEPARKIIVGVAGGSAAGKTTMCENINRQMAFDRNFKVEIVSLDSFYKNVDKTIHDVAEYNFDHPNSLDFDLAYKTLKNLIESNERVEIPQYSFIEHARMKQPGYVGPANIIFFEGLMAFYDKRIRDLMTYKIFINCDDDIRLCRRLKRDTTERGRSVISVLTQYNKFVKNSFRDFIYPSIVYADIIIPGFRNNRVSVDFIVQHIKNMARRISFKQKAAKTKTFIFGESQLYDLDYEEQYDSKVIMGQESFLVFPTSDEHKRQLEFFMTSLLSEIFSVEYFTEIYQHQFLKVLKALLRQLMTLKNFKSEQMQIFTISSIEEVMKLNTNNYPIKVIFFSVAETDYSKQILSLLKEYILANPKITFIILNTFCEMNVPKLIYKFRLSNVIMINLFVIANQRRFKEIMINNIQATTESFDWFVHNHQLANTACTSIAKEFQFYQRSEQEITSICYQMQLEKQKSKLQSKTIDQTKEKHGIIQQFNVYSQQHSNLCGFHALSNILCLESGADLQSKAVFIKNYHLLSNVLGKVTYEPLERHDVGYLFDSELFAHHKNLGVLYFSFKYIQNSEDELDNLELLFQRLLSKELPQIYILLGIYDHYILLKVTLSSISYYDSGNNSLTDTMNQTDTQFDALGLYSHADKEYVEYKKFTSNLKEAIEIVLDCLHNNKKVSEILIEKRIQEIVGSFDAIKSDVEGVEKWFKDSYPKQVIDNDLLKLLRERKVELNQKHKAMLHGWLGEEAIKKVFHEDERKLYY